MMIDVPTIDVSVLLVLIKEYNTELYHLHEIVGAHDEIIGNPDLLLSGVLAHADLLDQLDYAQIVEQQKYFLTKIKYITQTIKNITNDMHQHCVHEFVNDSIDIDCEHSQNITYCTVCAYTKP
jgi:hypothetical protein